MLFFQIKLGRYSSSCLHPQYCSGQRYARVGAQRSRLWDTENSRQASAKDVEQVKFHLPNKQHFFDSSLN